MRPLLDIATPAAVLRQIRVDAGVTLDDLARRIGVRESTLSRWEREVIRPHLLSRKAWVAEVRRIHREYSTPPIEQVS